MMGTHSLPSVLARRFRTPRALCLCQWCNLDALYDEGTVCWSALLCAVCGAVPCLVQLRLKHHACSYSCDSMALWGSRTAA